MPCAIKHKNGSRDSRNVQFILSKIVAYWLGENKVMTLESLEVSKTGLKAAVLISHHALLILSYF